MVQKRYYNTYHALPDTDQILHWLSHVEDEEFDSDDSLYGHHNLH